MMPAVCRIRTSEGAHRWAYGYVSPSRLSPGIALSASTQYGWLGPPSENQTRQAYAADRYGDSRRNPGCMRHADPLTDPAEYRLSRKALTRAGVSDGRGGGASRAGRPA